MKTKSLIFTFTIILLALGCSKDKDTNATQNNGDTTPPTGGIIFNPNLTYGTVTDIDGNAYKTITIGTQTWMAENLKTTRYRNGDTIPNVTNNTAWSNLTMGAYCDYGNTPSRGTIYGKLYNWHAVNDPRNICPAGWHVPHEAEFETLGVYLGGYQVIGGKMKETGITHWAYTNPGATNESGFTAIPGGMRDFGGLFSGYGNSGFWWSSSKANDYYDLEAHYYFLSGAGDNNFLDGYGNKTNGMSVRCVKD